MFMMTLLSGYDVTLDLLGIIAGHVYYFMEFVVPRVPETRSVKLLKAPAWLTNLCTYMRLHDFGANDFNDNGFGGGVAAFLGGDEGGQ